MKQWILIVLWCSLVLGARAAAQVYFVDTIPVSKEQVAAHTKVAEEGGKTVDLNDVFNPPKPEWVPDQSAGHYDCPYGWTAVISEEPHQYQDGVITGSWTLVQGELQWVWGSPNVDKKGHELREKPPEPKCVKN